MTGVDVVIMAKAFARAKSRLRGITPDQRVELCWAMLLDTLAAVQPAATRVEVVSDEPGLADRLARHGFVVGVVTDPGQGLNAAVRAADGRLGATEGGTRIAVVADLPALRPWEFAEISKAAGDSRHSFVADNDGAGTTMIAAAGGPLAPHFGPDSAARHLRSGATALAGDWPGARRDVDTLPDLHAAQILGVGRWTTALLTAAAS